MKLHVTVRAVNEALKRSALAPVVAAAALPLALLEAASGLVSIFSAPSFLEVASFSIFFAVCCGGGQPGRNAEALCVKTIFVMCMEYFLWFPFLSSAQKLRLLSHACFPVSSHVCLFHPPHHICLPSCSRRTTRGAW